MTATENFPSPRRVAASENNPSKSYCDLVCLLTGKKSKKFLFPDYYKSSTYIQAHHLIVPKLVSVNCKNHDSLSQFHLKVGKS